MACKGEVSLLEGEEGVQSRGKGHESPELDSSQKAEEGS